MIKALYPGSFDPVTNGHLDVVTRAANLFDEVVVAVYDTPSKSLLFSTEERVDLFRRAAANLLNVSVVPYSGLTVDFAHKIAAKAILRGLRMGSDFEYELQLALMNRKLAPGIETVCLMTTAEYQYVSSSLLKEAVSMKGNVKGLVPPHVLEALQEKYGLTARQA
ncbi:MAG: pantetheine-phosphate adenylyltransferase [Chloroflexi bacterium]|nr:pantetheine-phosphate adenylyltransferase [Chloroflexota bacterium]